MTLSFMFISDFLHVVFFVPGDKFTFPFIPFVCRVCHLELTEKQWTVFYTKEIWHIAD